MNVTINTNKLNLKILLVPLVLISVLPFCIITIYNHPTADDFCFFVISRQMNYLEAFKYVFSTWNGRYSSSLILLLPFSAETYLIWYKIVPLILFTGIIYSIRSFLSTCLNCISNSYINKITAIFFITYLFSIPSISEGFYWLSSSITYTLSLIFFLLFLKYLVLYFQGKELRFIVYSSVLSIFIIGFNETIMLILLCVIICLFLFQTWKEKIIDFKILYLIIISILFASIVLISNGNHIRLENIQKNENFVFAIKNSIEFGIKLLIKWFPIILIFSIISNSIIQKKIEDISKLRIFKVKPLLIIVICFAIIFVGLFPSFYGLGTSPPLRTLNIICFVAILFSFYLTMNIQVSFYAYNKNKSLIPLWVSNMMILMIILYLYNNNPIKNAYVELISFEAMEYSSQVKRRYESISQNKELDIQLKRITRRPSTIFHADISENPEDYKNKCLADFFNKFSIEIN